MFLRVSRTFFSKGGVQQGLMARAMAGGPQPRGVEYTSTPSGEDEGFRIHYEQTQVMGFGNWKETKTISPWHDIHLYASEEPVLLNYVNEIPKGTTAKMEIATKEEGNPIKQDIKKGALRFFKYGDIPFNYGALPQTWEHPGQVHPDTGYPGDNDPVDVVELSDALPMGAVVPVKILGIAALIDELETDWKVLALAKGHPLFDQVNNVADIEAQFPGFIATFFDWFKNYKTPDGKPVNTFAFEDRVLEQDYAMEVIRETNQAWKSLVAGQVLDDGGLSYPKKNRK